MSSSEGISATGHRSRVPTVRVMLLALHGLFCVLLVVGLIGSDRPVAWVLGGALAAAYALGLRATATDRRRSLWWLAAVSALWVALVVVAPTTAYLAFPLYFVVLHLLPRAWSLAAVAAITATVVATQATTSGGLTAAKVIGPCAGAAVAVLTAYGYVGMYREGRRRQQLIDDLVRAQSELAASQREAGRLAERQRLAREIHDTLAQGLSSIVLLARGAEGGLPEDAAARIREIRTTASANLAEARRFVAALTPPALEDATLGEALRRLASAHPGTTFHLDGTPQPLPMEAEVALLRTTQEALANVARHARADHAAVTLAYHPDQVTLDVFDDGIGFDDGTGADPARPRFGLHGMRERVAELGGSLTIESARGEGTAVAVALPTRLPAGPGRDDDPAPGRPGPADDPVAVPVPAAPSPDADALHLLREPCS
ncbi:MAG: sensor histidine kinase [Catenulispora sp.]|nr:sensor histidine kinase [Catenulispora sp.]